MRKFEIPEHYKSSIISAIKRKREALDPKRKDYSPTVLDFGKAVFFIARHFGFCFGVQNAVEIAYDTLERNKGKRIFLLSEMIHNPAVNEDLASRGLRFVFTSEGEQLIPWEEISSEDIVIIPAFGVSLEVEEILKKKGLDTRTYNTTCPFVERVWKKSAELGNKDFTVIIHGKRKHEETIATFSHARKHSPSVIVRDLNEAKLLGKIILNELPTSEFFELFRDKYSENFDPKKDLEKVGVVNQTTMLASETQEISEYFKEVMTLKYGEKNIHKHFADTRDTLCYATNDNQRATIELSKTDADLALVIGGYNSSNTTHLAELLAESFPVYFISDAEQIISLDKIRHFDFRNKRETYTENFLPKKEKVKIAFTSGASCPDSEFEKVLVKMLNLLNVGNIDAKAVTEKIKNDN
jgi:4-hydroxy-3-methylbut-2-enyl diphosphate reductase